MIIRGIDTEAALLPYLYVSCYIDPYQLCAVRPTLYYFTFDLEGGARMTTEALTWLQGVAYLDEQLEKGYICSIVGWERLTEEQNERFWNRLEKRLDDIADAYADREADRLPDSAW